ncbi:ribbon-helix-helix domain-containing protein [Asticcacaulis sp. SL142]|uniref:CopG family ribbon-helix-helix protein n=1 Tax=Asticcacaulis sp. SL142 TaxID=2995155 RepID=UPI00226CFD68|nr:ribbon-helix-helix domain-containing protein [Asticcacaulis sp. SL142]WAC49680.1 ribbon-helix-helix domain-containing protein [Asticcacaulis sp. SL142]
MAAKADTFSVRLPDDLKAEITRIAEATQRSRAFVIKEAVAAYVEDHRAYKAAIQEAIAEADKGVFISGEKVMAWLEELRTNPDAPDPEPDIFPETDTRA